MFRNVLCCVRSSARHTLQSYNSLLEHNSRLNIFQPAPTHLNTKLVCTVGPSSQDVSVLKDLVQRGMSVARLNFSHGTYEYHKKSIENVRAAAAECGRHVAIALDTKGPEVRTGPQKNVRTYAREDVVHVTTEVSYIGMCEEDCSRIYIDYAALMTQVHVGSLILIADGTLELRVESIELSKHWLTCVVVYGATVGGRNNVHVAGMDVDLPMVSERDAQDLRFGLQAGVDFIFASFVRSAENVKVIRGVMRNAHPQGRLPDIIAKIENHRGVENVNEILNEADGIMVARGDLGVEIPMEKVFLAQKLLISKCNTAGKPVVCATQMLESMTSCPRPTRAEATDVANAVLDGADAVMLSAESATGRYPREAVETLSRIALEAQGYIRHMKRFREMLELQSSTVVDTPSAIESVAASAVLSALELEAKCIITATTSGNSVRMISKYCASCPIIAVCQTKECARRLAVVRGVIPLHHHDIAPEAATRPETFEEAVEYGVTFVLQSGLVRAGECVIVTCTDVFPGSPYKASMKIRTL